MANNIVVIGFAGTGKSTIGRALAKKLNREFIETDSIWERTLKDSNGRLMSRKEFVAEHGENPYLDLETNAIVQACRFHEAVIALGGLAWQRQTNRITAKTGNVVVQIKADPEVIYRRLLLERGKRPVNEGIIFSSIDPLLAIRELVDKFVPQEGVDMVVLNNNQGPEEVVDKIIEGLSNKT